MPGGPPQAGASFTSSWLISLPPVLLGSLGLILNGVISITLVVYALTGLGIASSPSAALTFWVTRALAAPALEPVYAALGWSQDAVTARVTGAWNRTGFHGAGFPFFACPRPRVGGRGLGYGACAIFLVGVLCTRKRSQVKAGGVGLWNSEKSSGERGTFYGGTRYLDLWHRRGPLWRPALAERPEHAVWSKPGDIERWRQGMPCMPGAPFGGAPLPQIEQWGPALAAHRRPPLSSSAWHFLVARVLIGYTSVGALIGLVNDVEQSECSQLSAPAFDRAGSASCGCSPWT